MIIDFCVPAVPEVTMKALVLDGMGISDEEFPATV
jgi:hypothetical protein